MIVEVVWIVLFGAALAWLQARNDVEEEVHDLLPLDDEWARWEEEIHDWRDQT